MNLKDKIIIFLISAIIAVFLFVVSFGERHYEEASLAYQVYLNGEKLGLIADEDELYSIINNKHKMHDWISKSEQMVEFLIYNGYKK